MKWIVACTALISSTAMAEVPPTRLGVNLQPPSYWAGERAFMNLTAGSAWKMSDAAGKLVALPVDHTDANGNIAMLKTGEKGVKYLSLPTAAYAGVTVPITCRWAGTGAIDIQNWYAKNITLGDHFATFNWVPDGIKNVALFQTKTSATDPLRNLDCRETSADPTQTFDPTFLDTVRPYRAVRFMGWQNTNANLPVTWATRTTPVSGNYSGPDGVALEYMVQLANETRVDPWFNMPWNADDDYIQRFAVYVRDHLDPSLTAHVEASNEVWNWTYKVTTQANTEGLAEKLTTSDNAWIARYAEKTAQVMRIWSDVYAGKMSRLVRVIAMQTGSGWLINQEMSFKDTPAWVDAIATAPYFGWNLDKYPVTDLNVFFTTSLPGAMNETFKNVAAGKIAAAKYGKRFISYEAGQHVFGNDVVTATAIARDPRMGAMYTTYLKRWQTEGGDLTMLVNDVGPISKYGAWGMQEYIGQPLSAAPKAAAVAAFIATLPPKPAPVVQPIKLTPAQIAAQLRAIADQLEGN